MAVKLRSGAFFVLNMPAGTAGGFTFVALGYRLAHAGIHVATAGALISIFVFVQIVRALWAPFLDTTWTRRRWHLAGCVLCALGLAGMCMVTPGARNLVLLGALVLAIGVAAGTITSSVEGLVATTLPDAEKGRAGGFIWAGVFGGQLIGGGLGLWLLEHVSATAAASTLGGLALACTLPLGRLRPAKVTSTTLDGAAMGGRARLSPVAPGALNDAERPAGRVREPIGSRLAGTVRDLAAVLRTTRGVLLVAACVIPAGAGAANSLWGAVAADWGATADLVALVTGTAGPLLISFGCIVGGWATGRLGAWANYVTAGAALAGVAIAMGSVPRTPTMFAGFSLSYQFLFGYGTGALAGLVFATIGGGAGSTKCAALFGLSSAPAWYMTLADGWAHDRFGPRGMLDGDGLAALVGLVLLAALALALVPAARSRLRVPVAAYRHARD